MEKRELIMKHYLFLENRVAKALKAGTGRQPTLNKQIIQNKDITHAKKRKKKGSNKLAAVE